MGAHEHKSQAPVSVGAAVVTVSTSRTLEQDKSGHWIAEQLQFKGHEVTGHLLVPDSASHIKKAVQSLLDIPRTHVILVNGGTGITASDVTIEAIRPLFDKEMTAYGVLFAQLSYQEIGSSAILSRATAGVIGQAAVFCMPGSLGACKLACSSLIFPELGHISKHLRQDT